MHGHSQRKHGNTWYQGHAHHGLARSCEFAEEKKSIFLREKSDFCGLFLIFSASQRVPFGRITAISVPVLPSSTMLACARGVVAAAARASARGLSTASTVSSAVPKTSNYMTLAEHDPELHGIIAKVCRKSSDPLHLDR